MVINVPIAGWENSKRWSGLAGGAERQAVSKRTAASSGETLIPMADARRNPEGVKAEATERNIQHPTSNIQHPIASNWAVAGFRVFIVGW